MSVLYPLTLRRNYTHTRPRKSNSTIKFVLFLLIAIISVNGSFAQEVSKEEQNKKEIEQKKQANPTLKERLGSKKDRSTQSPVQLSVEAEKKLIKEKEQAEANKLAAER